MADDRMTFADFAKSRDPDGSQAQVFELMEQSNPPMQDAPAYPANAPLGNRTTLRRSLPSVGTAKINKGVTRSKSATDQRVDTIGYFAGRSEIDVRIRKIEGAAAYMAKRRDEDAAFQEALSQLVCNTLFYGDVKLNEASFDGFAPRMAALNAGASFIAAQVWSMGSVTGGDGCSIYIVDWGERACGFIYPPNTVAGLDTQDLPNQPVLDADSASFQADVSLFDWFAGLCVKDPRHMARLANIDLSDALLLAPTQGFLIDTLDDMLSYMPDPGGAQRVMYCPVALESGFRKQARSRANQALSIQDYLNKPTVHYWNIPIRGVRQLSTAEATVS